MRRIAFSRLAGGDEAALHLHEVIGGRGAGPTIGISAAVHGDEVVGTQILMAMMRRLQDSDLKGRLLLLPVANPYSFEARTRHNPIDDLNLNRVFPGMAGGWFSEQLAHTIVQEFPGRVEVLIDLHAGGPGRRAIREGAWNDAPSKPVDRPAVLAAPEASGRQIFLQV